MKLRRRHKKQHGTKTTLGLVIILVLILLVIWSEFISGSNRVKEQIYTQRVEKIEKQNKHIKGISEHVFDYTRIKDMMIRLYIGIMRSLN